MDGDGLVVLAMGYATSLLSLVMRSSWTSPLGAFDQLMYVFSPCVQVTMHL